MSHDLRLERVYDAAAEVVFDAFTDPEAQQELYADAPDWIVEATCDLRVGGRWTIAFGPAGSTPAHETNVFQVVDRPRRLVYASTMTMPDGSSVDTRMQVTFEEEDGRTRMTIIRLNMGGGSVGPYEHVIAGLEAGADDYLTKPFNLEELLLRVDKLIKKSGQLATRQPIPEVYQFGKNKIDFKALQCSNKKGESIMLSKKEGMLLKLLIEHKNEVVTREKILQSVWGYNVYPTTRTIDNFILNFIKITK